MRFGGVKAIEDLSLKVKEGVIMSIIGPNGAGKTTVFNCLTGFAKPARGSIYFSDTEIIGLSPHRIAKLGISRTFQNIRLFRDMSVLENVMVAQHIKTRSGLIGSVLRWQRFRDEERVIREKAMEYLVFAGLSDYAGGVSGNLPYGLQRRLEIARALATRPKLLLLDEPAAGMNPNEVAQLMEFIQWIRKEFNLSILLIEHQMHLVMNICERLLVLDFGETIAEGRPRDIQNNPRVLEVYLGEVQC